MGTGPPIPIGKRVIKTPATPPCTLAVKLMVIRHHAGYIEDDPNAEPDDGGNFAGIGLWTAIEDAERLAG